jgi:hypothetical protein
MHGYIMQDWSRLWNSFFGTCIQGKIANNFIAIFIDVLIINGSVPKVDVLLKLLSFGVHGVFVF